MKEDITTAAEPALSQLQMVGMGNLFFGISFAATFATSVG
jgi:hypothetical protein